jgi:hypothetical protein
MRGRVARLLPGEAQEHGVNQYTAGVTHTSSDGNDRRTVAGILRRCEQGARSDLRHNMTEVMSPHPGAVAAARAGLQPLDPHGPLAPLASAALWAA